MNIKQWNKASVLTMLMAGLVTGTSTHAATYTLYGDRTAFLSALGGTPLLQQDFEGFASGTNMAGTAILPGVTASTNLASLEVFQGSGDKELFALPRNQIDAYYDINIASPYKIMGFDIEAFNPATTGPGFLDVYFADGDAITDIPYLPTNATELDPLFFGVIANTDITRIRWSEGPELNGACCEETALDNFVAPVPIPAALPLLISGLVGLGFLGRRRRA